MGGDFWAMVVVVLVGTLGLALLVWARARRKAQVWKLFDVALAFAALLWVSGSAGALVIRAVTGAWDASAVATIPLLPTILSSAVGSFAAVGVALVLGRPWRDLGFQPTSRRSLVAAVGLALAFLALSMLWVQALEAFGIEVGEQKIVALLRSEWGSAGMVVAVIYGVLLAPLFEEILFRGFALPPLVRALGPAPAIIIDALAFGVVHLDDPAAVPPLALLGATLALLRYRTGSIWPSLALHFANNAMAFVILLSGR